jgi:hypothetical protein
MRYYYLLTALPTLSLEAPLPLRLADFRARCAEHLATGDLRRLDAVLAYDGVGPVADPFLRRWQTRERLLRNACARLRGAREERDAAPYLRPVDRLDLALEHSVADALARRNPAEREVALDRLRWQALDELGGYDPFAFEALCAYALKLRLCVRWAQLTDEKGEQRVAAIVARAGSSA